MNFVKLLLSAVVLLQPDDVRIFRSPNDQGYISESPRATKVSVLIPFSDESQITQREIDSIKAGIDEPFEPQIHEQIGSSLVVRLGHEPMPRHLVRVHGCPQWVADLYSKDAKNLARIHRGYELMGLQSEYSEKEFHRLWTDPYSIDYRQMHQFYAERREHYGKFKLLRVTSK